MARTLSEYIGWTTGSGVGVCRLAVLLGAWLLVTGATAAPPSADFEVLCYHEVRDDVFADLDGDAYAVSTDRLVQHFDWLKAHGWHPVSVDDILAARRGERSLPPKAVLLTFDDGYESFYTRIFPLLRAYRYPAVMALVTSWLQAPPGGTVRYGDRVLKPREAFLGWDQIREMQASGLVEFASHSHDLHHGVRANPQGNLQPAAAVHRYDADARRYETDAEYRRRVHDDLAESVRIIEARTGRAPRVMVWPYGAYNAETLAIARELGMAVTLTLSDTPPRLAHLEAVGRHLIEYNPALGELLPLLRRVPDRTPLRAAHVDLDYLYDEDPMAQRGNLDRLLDRIKALRISTVFLQAFADPDGDGTASALYFPNRHLPVRADLFNRVAWQLATRAGVRVYAWMPVLAFDVPGAGRLRVQGDGAKEPGQYRRLSPFVPAARRIVREIYDDLGRHARFDGVIFHDDALLTDFEDARPEARAVYRQWGLPDDLGRLRGDPGLARRWALAKARYLTDFTLELAAVLRRWQPALRTARNAYAPVVLEPQSTAWFAQDYADMLRAYDHVAVMAMPLMEQAGDADAFFGRLVAAARAAPGGLARTVFELQTRDWRRDRAVDVTTLERWVERLRALGARHFAWYPDDFIDGHPPLAATRARLSVSDYPYPLPR